MLYKFRWKCLHYEIARIENNTPSNILEKVCTHTALCCDLENCYICSKEVYVGLYNAFIILTKVVIISFIFMSLFINPQYN